MTPEYGHVLPSDYQQTIDALKAKNERYRVALNNLAWLTSGCRYPADVVTLANMVNRVAMTALKETDKQ